MKSVIIYYSLEGNTKLIAELISKEINGDLIELKCKKEFPSKGFKKYFWGGKSAIFRETPELINFNVDLSKYENIFLGTPVWAGTYAPAFNTFFRDNSISNKNIGLFVCSGGGKVEKCFNNFKKHMPNNNFIGEISFVDPKENINRDYKQEIKQWILTMKYYIQN